MEEPDREFRQGKRYFTWGFLIALAMVAVAIGGWWYFQPTQGEKKLSTLMNPSREDKQQLIDRTQQDQVLSTPTPPPPPIPKAEIRQAVTQAMTDKSYATLKEYMEPEVEVIIAATECCGTIPAEQAITQLDYLNNGLPPWTFDDSNPKVTTVRNNHPGYQPAVVGVAFNNYSVIFGMSQTNRIEKIRLAVELIPQAY